MFVWVLKPSLVSEQEVEGFVVDVLRRHDHGQDGENSKRVGGGAPPPSPLAAARGRAF